MPPTHFAHHILKIRDSVPMLTFYREALGFEVIGQGTRQEPASRTEIYRLAAPSTAEASTPTVLEFWHRPEYAPAPDAHYWSAPDDGYWKIGLCLPDVDLARERLLSRGVAVDEPRQFRDIGYLCHLRDPDGFAVELLQHRFAQNHRPVAPDPSQPLGSKPTLGQVTLRVRDAAASLAFYQEVLGLRLLSRQEVEPYGFTLYFLASTNERPPVDDLDAVANREWLWQRPYTTLELQHRWGADPPVAAYRLHDDQPFGFRGLGFTADDPAALLAAATETGATPDLRPGDHDSAEADEIILRDPDGFRIRLSKIRSTTLNL